MCKLCKLQAILVHILAFMYIMNLRQKKCYMYAIFSFKYGNVPIQYVVHLHMVLCHGVYWATWLNPFSLGTCICFNLIQKSKIGSAFQYINYLCSICFCRVTSHAGVTSNEYIDSLGRALHSSLWHQLCTWLSKVKSCTIRAELQINYRGPPFSLHSADSLFGWATRREESIMYWETSFICEIIIHTSF